MESTLITIIAVLLAGLATSLAVAMYFYASKSMPAFVFAAILLYSMGSKQISVIYLDLVPTYVSESGSWTYWSGASIRVFLAHSTIILGVVSCIIFGTLVISKLLKAWREDYSESTNYKIWMTFCGGCLGIQFVNLAMSSSLAFPGMAATRYDFWDTYARFPILVSIFGELMAFVPLVVAVCLISANARQDQFWRFFAYLVIGFYCVFLLSTGQRFHGLLLAFGPAFGIWVLEQFRVQSKLITTRRLLVSLTLGASLFCYAIFDFSTRRIADEHGSGLSALTYRVFALQGQVLWNVDALVSASGPRGNLSDLNDGMDSLMELIMPRELYSRFETTGVNLSTGLPAITMYIFGFWKGLVPLFIYGLVEGLVFMICYIAYLRRSGSISLFASYIWIWCNAVYASSTIKPLLDWKFPVFAGIAIILICLPKFSINLSSPLRKPR